jgi:uncharacterized membrane protein YhiD involved in acid resistance
MDHSIQRLIAVLLLAAAIGLQSPDVYAGGYDLGLNQTASQVQTETPAKSDNPLVNAATNTTDSGPQPAPRSWTYDALSVFGRLLLAVGLSAVLAFRPRQDVPLFKRSLFVSQTQILLSVVAAALMMIVGDNTARAFAIFAAVSLVRFRTNIRDPKEITVLLISLALGLAAGVGRWELGIGLCIFALALLWLLEYNESAQVYRSMELTIKTRNPDRTQEVLRKIFRKYKLEAEVRELDSPDDDDPIGSIVYYLNLRLNLSTDYLSDRILRLDPRNIDAIQWSQKKGATDIYQ